MNDQQSYAGQGDRQTGTSEWNRMNAAIRSVTNQMATMTLVKVLAVRGQFVDIQPIVAQMDGAGNAVEHGTIHNVPVWRYQAGAAAVIVNPLVDDVGMAVFAHSDISTAKATGDASPPGSKRRFDWADAVYLGGVLSNIAPTTSITLSAAGGVVITSNQPVTVNANAVVNGDVTATGRLTAATATIGGKEFATHVHTLVTAGMAASGPVGP